MSDVRRRSFYPRPLSVRSAAVLTALVVTHLLTSSVTSAQDAQSYVGAGAALSPWRPESNSSGASLSFRNVSDQDWAPAVQLEAGGFASRTVGLGLEFTLPTRRDVEQTYSYYPFGYLAEVRYREARVFALARLHPRGRGPGVIVAGVGAVRQGGIERRAPQVGLTSAYGPFGADVHTTRWTWGATAGLDVAFPLGGRASLVPQARAILVARGETYEATAFADLGLPRFSYKLALTLRAHF